MRITYDKEVDALRIIFMETTVSTKELGDGIALDFDSDGKIAGIEVLDVSTRLGEKDTLRKIVLEGIGVAV